MEDAEDDIDMIELDSPEIVYEDFKDDLGHKLNELRETNILCDTTIRAQGQDFPAGRYKSRTGSTRIDSDRLGSLKNIKLNEILKLLPI